jgi:hypothetical protein
MLEDQSIVDRISAALCTLEEQGDLVLTTAHPDKVARFIFHSALAEWLEEIGDSEEPIECTIPHLLVQTAAEVEARFGVQHSRALEISNLYYNEWLKTRTMKEIAEIYWHETPQEMARRAYYHIELGKPDNRDLEYLEWRKSR